MYAYAVILVLVVVLVFWYREYGDRKKAHFCGNDSPPSLAHKEDAANTGPYNLQLYDSPRYYPFYQGRDWTYWDTDGRCSAYCRDDGCTEVCR